MQKTHRISRIEHMPMIIRLALQIPGEVRF